MQYDYNNPETWRLQCSTCEEYILYEKLHRYHNAKSSMKRGNLRCCDKCKEANRKVSLNTEDWHIPCSTCNEPIKYDNLASFRTVYGGYLKGHNRECEQCVTTTRKNIVRKDRIYSRDPKDWVVDCGNSECNRKITYNNLKSYQGSMKRRKDGNPPLCFSCVSKKCDRTTEEWKNKCRGRKWSESTRKKFNDALANRTIEQRIEINKKRSIARQEYWNNLPEEIYNVRVEGLIAQFRDIPEKRKQEIFEESSCRMIDMMLNSNTPFTSGYNKNTIKYIEEILNTRFNTIFRHGADVNGEFRVYDHKLKTLYFADAYCPKLNLWIEFDEPNKFARGKLKESHISRHKRIQEILNCPIIRIKYKNSKIYEEFFEYYNDVLYWGNLNEPIKKFIREIKLNKIEG